MGSHTDSREFVGAQSLALVMFQKIGNYCSSIVVTVGIPSEINTALDYIEFLRRGH